MKSAYDRASVCLSGLCATHALNSSMAETATTTIEAALFITRKSIPPLVFIY
jgi:hypothetical protein